MGSSRSTPNDALAKLERRVLEATMRRYREHRKLYPVWDPNGHSPSTNAMVDACRKLYEATNGK